MEAEKCLFCGADIPEGQQICPQCEKKYTPPDQELLRAFDEGRPVEYKGVKYGCISALIIRKRAIHRSKLPVSHIVQVELMSGRTNSVIIAAPKDVTVLKDWRGNNADQARK